MIKQNLENIKETLTDTVCLVAVSKTKPIADIQTAYDAGQRDFGENKVQELVSKYESDLPRDIRWHMIGHLQRNKVKYIAEFVHLIHGVDSFKLLKEINKQAKKHNRVIDCLLQARIAQEDTKFGIPFSELKEILQSTEFDALENISVVGLMGMATFTDDQYQVRDEFKTLSDFFKELKKRQETRDKSQDTKNINLEILSMGMSGDYKLAIEEGSTMIRVGSAIFGTRNYLT